MTDMVWSHPHHDGSIMYVPDPTPRIGGKVTVLLRVPRSSDVTSAWVRVLCDGEPELVRAQVDRQDKRDTWLRADLRVVNPVVSYRWLLDGGPYGYQWLNGTGLHSHDVPDAPDFRISIFGPPPSGPRAPCTRSFQTVLPNPSTGPYQPGQNRPPGTTR